MSRFLDFKYSTLKDSILLFHSASAIPTVDKMNPRLILATSALAVLAGAQEICLLANGTGIFSAQSSNGVG